MDKTYRENIISYFTGVAKKHKALKYPLYRDLADSAFVLLFMQTFCN